LSSRDTASQRQRSRLAGLQPEHDYSTASSTYLFLCHPLAPASANLTPIASHPPHPLPFSPPLQARFGLGYTLTMTVAGGRGSATLTAAVAAHLQHFVPEAELLSQAGDELAFRLPVSSPFAN